jgi:hypothetical protein
MSVNWVMIGQDGFPITLPHEQFAYNGLVKRVDLYMESLGSSSKINCTNGLIYASKERLLYVPVQKNQVNQYYVHNKGDSEFKSLSVPLSKIQSHSIISPWFGPYKWQMIVEPVIKGGLEPGNMLWKAQFVFKDGGIVEFNHIIEQLLNEPREEPLPEYRP